MCDRFKRIRDRIEETCLRVGRDPSRVTVVAASKTKPAAMVRELYGCGQRVFGENYIQEAVEKIKHLEDLKGIKWHFIGHLQRNKARIAATYFDLVETVDSNRLARALDKYAARQGKMLNVLIQVNIGGEASKHGVLPAEASALIGEVACLQHLRVRGLMTIHPFSTSREEARKWFRQMAVLKERFSEEFPGLDLSELSMGMSSDFEVAVEEGATIVRIGTDLFGPRN